MIIDVLRDYRFYKKDLVHPNDTATEFVFESFCDTYVDVPGKKLLEEIRTIVTAMNHRPFQKQSAAHKKFMNLQLEKIKKIKSVLPLIDFSREEKFFSQ